MSFDSVIGVINSKSPVISTPKSRITPDFPFSTSGGAGSFKTAWPGFGSSNLSAFATPSPLLQTTRTGGRKKDDSALFSARATCSGNWAGAEAAKRRTPEIVAKDECMKE